jgi:hypothetical protein
VDDADTGVGGAGRGEVELPPEPLQDAVVLAAAGDGGQAGGFVDGDPVGGLAEDGDLKSQISDFKFQI